MSNVLGQGLFSADGPLYLWHEFMTRALNEPWDWNGQTPVGQTSFDAARRHRERRRLPLDRHGELRRLRPRRSRCRSSRAPCRRSTTSIRAGCLDLELYVCAGRAGPAAELDRGGRRLGRPRRERPDRPRTATRRLPGGPTGALCRSRRSTASPGSRRSAVSASRRPAGAVRQPVRAPSAMTPPRSRAARRAAVAAVAAAAAAVAAAAPRTRRRLTGVARR